MIKNNFIEGPHNFGNNKHPRPIIASCYYLGFPLSVMAKIKNPPSFYIGDVFAECDDIFSEVLYRVGKDKLNGFRPSYAYAEFKKFKRRFYSESCISSTNTELAIYFTDWLLFARNQGWSYNDYFNYECYNKEIKIRNTFLNHADWEYFSDTFNVGKRRNLISEKTLFNNAFKDFIKRDWLDMNKATYEEFAVFANKHTRFFMKPTNGTGGIGSCIIDVSEMTTEEAYKRCLKERTIIEELIEQFEELAAFNESTLNTVRIETLIGDDGVPRPMLTLARFGRKDKVADNFHSGGVGALIDIETGIINTLAINRVHEKMQNHPDSGIAITGFKYPKWEELLKTACKAALVIPECKNIGWDLAITKNGEIELIEGNTKPGFDVLQSADQVGKYYRFEPYIEGLERKMGLEVHGGSYYTHKMNDISIKGMERLIGHSLFMKEKEFKSINTSPREIVSLGYQAAEHNEVNRRHADIEPRYEKNKLGIWEKKSKNITEKAVLAFCGDLMCQSPQQNYSYNNYGYYNFDENIDLLPDLFKNMDLCIGNLETLLDDKCSYTREKFKADNNIITNTPSIFLDSLRFAGFDMLVTSNNHNCDCGINGLKRTIRKLKEYQFINTGIFLSGKTKRYEIVNVNGIKVGILSYSTKFNGNQYYWNSKARKHHLHMFNIDRLKQEVKKAKEAGAEFIVVYIHWGQEGHEKPDLKQQKRAKAIAEAGADYIIGSHTHCLQSYDVINTNDGREVPVAYSLGNFLSSETESNYTEGINVYVSAIINIRLERRNNKVLITNEDYIVTRRLINYEDKFNVIVPLTNRNYDSETEIALIEAKEYARRVVGEKIKPKY